jgi:hypothetical protein
MTDNITWQPADIPEPPRDRYMRPMIIPPEGGERVPYTRCTTYVGALEDTYNLGLWQKRMVAVGLAQRPDLLLRASSLGLPPSRLDIDAEKVWKTRMNEVCDRATEAAGASGAATIGTSLHALAETLDRGYDVGVVPEQYRRHLDNYAEATRDYTAIHVETFTVNDDLQVGGTPDRILKVPGHDRLIIGDIKTGSTIYGVGKMTMQLAVYAHSMLYDPRDGRRAPIGDVDLEHGLIIALNADTGTCDLIDIDIAAGWEAVQLAGRVRDWRARSRGSLSKPWRMPLTLTGQLQESIRRVAETLNAEPIADVRPINPDVSLVKAIQKAGTEAELVALWRSAGDRWLPRHTEMAAERKRQLQHA